MPRRPAQPNPALEYAEAVVAGEIVTGRLVRLTCERHLEDLETGHRRGLRFDVAAGNRIINFFDFVHHFQGPWATVGICTCGDGPDGFKSCPNTVKLDISQQFFLASIFGWQHYRSIPGITKGRWLRRFQLVYKQVARKNAKTLEAAAIGDYMLGFDGEAGARVFAAATKKEQARETHNAAKEIVRLSPQLRSRIHGSDALYTNLYTDTSARFEVLTSDAKKLDSFSVHAAIIDEYHEHKTAAVLETLRTGMGARPQPLALVTTTAGLKVEGSPCKALRDRCVQILEGIKEDDRVFPYIAEIDEGDEWDDPAVFIKANPLLGVSVIDELEREVEASKSDPEARVHCQTKRLNMWVGSAKTWIPVEKWRSNPVNADPAHLRRTRCYGGLDMASYQDLCSFALVWPPPIDEGRGVWTVRVWYWIPEVKFNSRAEGDQSIKNWARDGWITVTGENETDYDRIRREIGSLAETYEIVSIGIDPHRAQQLSQQLMADGHLVVTQQQGWKTLAEPFDKFKALAMGGRLDHGGNPVLAWNVANAYPKTDDLNNTTLHKGKSLDHIDGCYSAANAIRRAMDGPIDQEIEISWGVI